MEQVRAVAGITPSDSTQSGVGGAQGGPRGASKKRVRGGKVLTGHWGWPVWPYSLFIMTTATTLTEHLLYTLYHTKGFACVRLVSPSQLAWEVGPITSPHFVGEITEAQALALPMITWLEEAESGL